MYSFFQRLQRRSDEEEDAMKSINENISSSENQNPNSNNNSSNSNSNSNSVNNSNSMGGVIAGGSWVIDSMQSPTFNNDKVIEKEVVKQEGDKEKQGEGEEEEEGDYVVDIYMQSDVTDGGDSNVPKSPEPGSHIPVVQVEG